LHRQQIILFVTLLFVSLISLFLKENTNLTLTRDVSSVLLYPVRITGNFVTQITISSVHIEQLENAVHKLKLENAALRDLLKLDTTQLVSKDLRLLRASVIGRDPLNINGYLHVDKGTAHGVSINQPVISVDGFVGKVKYAGPSSSIVETIENQGFTVSAFDINTGIHGMIRCQTNLIFDYVRHSDSIHVGDSILTSGMSEVFPKGILIGTVRRISESDDLFFKRVYVVPATQVNLLTSLYIILNGVQSKAGDSP